MRWRSLKILPLPRNLLQPQPLPSSSPARGRSQSGLARLEPGEISGRIDGRTLLFGGLVISALGLVFGMVIYSQLKNLPVHKSMRDISDLIYETCKTYLLKQGVFIAMLWIAIALVIVFYFKCC